MAKESKRTNPPNIEFDALAEKMAPDPGKASDGVALTGLVGRSAEDGNIRLYEDASFSTYYEISIADVLHSQQLPATASPLGGSLVYIKSSAAVRRVQVSAEIEARFLQGPMSAAATSAAGAPSLSGAIRPFHRPPYFTAICGRSDARTSCADVCPGHRTVGCWGGLWTWDGGAC